MCSGGLFSGSGRKVCVLIYWARQVWCKGDTPVLSHLLRTAYLRIHTGLTHIHTCCYLPHPLRLQLSSAHLLLHSTPYHASYLCWVLAATFHTLSGLNSLLRTCCYLPHPPRFHISSAILLLLSTSSQGSHLFCNLAVTFHIIPGFIYLLQSCCYLPYPLRFHISSAYLLLSPALKTENCSIPMSHFSELLKFNNCRGGGGVFF